MASARSLKPVLNPGDYVFCPAVNIDATLEGVIGFFTEREGKTFIISRTLADQLGIQYENLFSWITLSVQTSLDEVGITAAFSAALTRAGITCNVVAAYHHDHLFVPKGDATRALEVLSGVEIGPGTR